MAQVSKKQLPKKVEKRIKSLLTECISACKDEKAAADFIEILLSPTEKVMIAKRIAIGLMLTKDYNPSEIVEAIKVSLGTVYNVKAWLDLKGSGYRKMLKKIAAEDQKRAKRHQELLEGIDSIMPPRPGISWKEHRRRQWQEIEKMEVPF